MNGKIEYDEITDMLLCEYPVNKEGDLCHRWFKNLGRHLYAVHKVKARDYKIMMGVDLKTPLIAKSVQKKMREKNKLAKSYLNLRPSSLLQKGKVTIQNYQRSPQTIQRLRKISEEYRRQQKKHKKIKK